VISALEQHAALSQIHASTAKACMAERGYTYSKRSEFEVRCR
jgi:hypothetical protein